MPQIPEGGRSVVERRAAAAVAEAEEATRARWRQLDWFATPPWATRAGIGVARQIDELFGAGLVWEPACGDGIMAKVLADEVGHKNVVASDIEPQGFGLKRDFLLSQEYGVRWIFTNPPFAEAAAFVEHGLAIAKVGVAVLCRLSFLESAARYRLHNSHLTDLAIFCERVPMQLGPWNPKGSTATAYAWFFFDKAGATEVPRLHLIAPGMRDRLTKPDDPRRFVTATGGALL